MFTEHIWEHIQLQELQLISNNASFRTHSTALGACCIIHSCTLLVLNSEGWRETKRIMYAPSTHSARIFMMFTVNFYQNAVNGGTLLIKARALGLFQGDDLHKDLEISIEFRDFLGGYTTPAPRRRVISLCRSILEFELRRAGCILPNLKSGFACICQKKCI